MIRGADHPAHEVEQIVERAWRGQDRGAIAVAGSGMIPQPDPYPVPTRDVVVIPRGIVGAGCVDPDVFFSAPRRPPRRWKSGRRRR